MPEQFIDELFELYNDDSSTLQTDFVIKLSAVIKWLKSRQDHMVRTLKRSYVDNVDYIITRPNNITKKDNRNNNYKEYLLTPDCFKRLAMMSRSKNAELIRTYFIEVEGLFIKYRDQTLLGMQADLERLHKADRIKRKIEPKSGYLYIVKASEKQDGLYKIGRSKDLIQRLRAYNTGRSEDIDLLYVYQTPDIHGAEICAKGFLKKYQLRKYKEVYQANLALIKDLIGSCARIGAKLVHRNSKERMTGGYYIVIDSDDV